MIKDKPPIDVPLPKPTPIPAGEPYVLVLADVRVRTNPSTAKSPVIYVAHKNEKLQYLRKSEFDTRGNEWYYVSTPFGNGYISAFTTSQRKYTLLVTDI